MSSSNDPRDESAAKLQPSEQLRLLREQTHIKTIHRDRKWYASTKEQRDDFWKLVNTTRQGTYELPVSSLAPKKAKLQICLIKED